jgi:capsule polysaccharide export protein KpsE/RkpR
MTSQELYNEMKQTWDAFEKDHVRFYEKNVKAAGARARKAATHLKKLASQYRNINLHETRDK